MEVEGEVGTGCSRVRRTRFDECFFPSISLSRHKLERGWGSDSAFIFGGIWMCGMSSFWRLGFKAWMDALRGVLSDCIYFFDELAPGVPSCEEVCR